MGRNFSRLTLFAIALFLISPRAVAAGFGDLGGYFSFHLGDGGLPDGIDSTIGTQQTSADGLAVKLSGSCGPITGAQFEPGFVLYWGGSFEGPIRPGDFFTADIDLSVNVTGGDLGWSFYADLFSPEESDRARILTSVAPMSGGALTNIHLQSTPFTTEGDGGSYESYIHIDWTNYSPTDTFSITIPSHSVDITYVPEPAMTSVLLLLPLMRRRRI